MQTGLITYIPLYPEDGDNSLATSRVSLKVTGLKNIINTKIQLQSEMYLITVNNIIGWTAAVGKRCQHTEKFLDIGLAYEG
jgi:hypothetical protein